MNNFLRRGVLRWIAPCAVLLAGCGGDNDTTVTPTPIPPADWARFSSQGFNDAVNDLLVFNDDLVVFECGDVPINVRYRGLIYHSIFIWLRRRW